MSVLYTKKNAVEVRVLFIGGSTVYCVHSRIITI